MALSNTAVPIEYGKFRDAVLKGEIPVCAEISMEMNRIDYLIKSPEFYYDDEAINEYVAFAESELTLSDGAPLNLLPSFKLWAESALAWFYFKDEKVWNPELKRYEIVTVKKRLTNKQFLIVARGGAKSMYCSTMQSYGLVMDTDTTDQIVVGPTIDQTEEILNPMRTAISRAIGPVYRYLTTGNILANNHNKIKLASTKKGIQNFITNSIVRTRPMSVDKLQGLRCKYATIDEWLSGHVKEDVIGAIEQGASKIDDYLIVATSSEGTERDGIGDSIKMMLLSILKGDYYAPNVSIWYYRLDDIKEVGKPEMWLKANPNLGATISYDAYEKDVALMEADPTQRNDILAKRFGIPVEGLSYYFKYEDTLVHPAKSFNGMYCAVGADLSQGDDFCAFTFLFPYGNKFGVKTRSYVSRSKVIKLPKAMQIKYDSFVNEGSLIIMDEPILNMDVVFDDLLEHIDSKGYIPITMGYDPYNAAVFIKRWAATFGEYGIETVRQGYKTESVPLGELQNLANARMLIFDEELMKFAMGNAIVRQDTNGNMKLDKKRDIEKIDNVAALMDAWVAYTKNREAFD